MKIPEDARDFAVLAHGDQKYGDQHPYSHHLDAVVAILAPFGPEAQIVGYLHDVVEDTPVTLDEVAAQFGDRIAALVAIVTDETGGNRKERKQKTNAKLAAVSPDLNLALIVKAADRLANVRQSVAEQSPKFNMYVREHQEFRLAAYRPGLCDDFWKEIDSLLD